MNDSIATTPEYLPPNAVESVSRAEIDISISTAIKYPHHSPDRLSKVKQDMMTFATMDQATAEACFYTIPRGDKNIEGPSVRMAEIAVAFYGNVRMGTRILSVVTEGDNPHVVVQAVGHDLEKNIYVSIEKRRRIVKKRSKNAIDEDDINLATNACSAICFRDVTFKIVPQALIKPVFEACRKVAIGDQKTLVDRRGKMIATFGAMGIRSDKIIAKLDKRSVEDIGADDLQTLIGLYNAIKEGELNIDDAFAIAGQVASATPQHSPAPTGLQQSQQGLPHQAPTPPPAQQPSHPAPVPEAPKSAALQAQEADAKRRGRPPGSKNKVEKLTPKEAAEIVNGGTPVASSAIAYPEGKGPSDYDANGDLFKSQPTTVAAAPSADDSELAAMGLAPENEAKTEPETTVAPEAREQSLLAMEFKPWVGESSEDACKRAKGYIGMLLETGGVSLDQLMGFCIANKLSKPGQKLGDLATDKLWNLGKNFSVLLPKIRSIQV